MILWIVTKKAHKAIMGRKARDAFVSPHPQPSRAWFCSPRFYSYTGTLLLKLNKHFRWVGNSLPRHFWELWMTDAAKRQLRICSTVDRTNYSNNLKIMYLDCNQCRVHVIRCLYSMLVTRFECTMSPSFTDNLSQMLINPFYRVKMLIMRTK